MTAEGKSPMDASTHHDTDVAPELEPLHLEDKPDGPGAAMMISAGIGIFILGLLTTLAAMSESINTWLGTWAMGMGVGPLAGKTTIATIAYFGSLILLWALWRNKDVNIKTAFYVGFALGVLGAIGTFPTFFEMFHA